MSTILTTNARKLDLGTLATLERLLAQRNLSQVGRQVGLSQPAMSHLLARARLLFADPLLVREGATLVLTAQGQRLREELETVLPAVDALFRPRSFDPSQATTLFKLAITDHAGQVVLPAILRSLTEAAPHTRTSIAMIPNRQTDLADLDEQQYDLRIGWLRSLPSRWRRRKLLDDRIVLLAACDHPGIGDALTVTQFTALDHIALESLRPMYPNLVDNFLALQGLERNIVSRVSHFSMVPPIVAATTLVSMVPRRLARLYVRRYPLRIVEPPLAFPGNDLSLAWHPRIHQNQDYIWLRQLIFTAVEEGIDD